MENKTWWHVEWYEAGKWIRAGQVLGTEKAVREGTTDKIRFIPAVGERGEEAGS